MIEVRRTAEFEKWLNGLTDVRAYARISKRLVTVEGGSFGDWKPVGDGISELRIDYGQGYRLYYVQRGQVVIVLLCGGDKSTQAKDIKLAKELAKGV